MRVLVIEIESNTHATLHHQRLVHANEELRFDETSRHYNVVEGSTIFMALGY